MAGWGRPDKIYFDIDGVLRYCASPSADVAALLRYCLDTYPGALYWLTTHCRGGVNAAERALTGVLADDLRAEVMAIFRPTDWNVLKTDAIDFNSRFIWLDDSLLYAEQAVLQQHHAVDGFFRMNPKDPHMAEKALMFLRQVTTTHHT
ncbi:hypothetical protein L1281_000908 [Neisseria sp. HSC-16F19]|nr:hypothetical protein [Neisseria sp. HSC-16F19]MCP2040326.1 hypothetical protein [Neisseria sp. HSC-16F19]